MKDAARIHKPWSPALHGAHAHRATTIALEVARRCSSRKLVQQVFEHHAEAQEGPPLRWLPQSVAGGDAGIALLSTYIHHCFPNEGWDRTAHQHLSDAVMSYNAHPSDISLFSGAAGLAFTAAYSSQQGAHYSSLRKNLNAYLEQRVSRLMNTVSKRSKLSVPDFDVISGAAGLTVYLTSLPKDTLSNALREACDAALTYLASLAHPSAVNGLRCFIAPEQIHLAERQQEYPYGYSDTGLAHGVSGVIGALAIATYAGWGTPGVRNALASLAQWLTAQSIQDDYGINWPTFIQPAACGTQPKIVHSRSAWCYGTPGIARVLFLAGEALDDSGLQQTAISAFDALMSRPRSRWIISSPNICHGLSGVLLSSLRMYHDTGHPSIRSFIEQLSQELLSLYDPDTPLGFQDTYGRYDWFANPRLLEGAPGVALTLLAASQTVPPDWDRFFLLS